MTNPSDKKVIEQLKSAVAKGEDSFEVEKELKEGDLETVSGGECQCYCAAQGGYGGSCGGGGGGGRSAGFEPEVNA